MKKVIIIRYCEIHLKGKNRNYFINLLHDNLKDKLKKYDLTLKKIPTRFLVEDFNEEEYEDILKSILEVCGVYTVSPAYIVESDYEKIKEVAMFLMKDKVGTFKVETNRADKKFIYHSTEFSCMLGGDILEAYSKNLKVDVHKPQTSLNIDIRESGDTLIFTDFIKGVSGMPIGSSGKGLLMLSGGIDSPVAGYMMCRRGMSLDAIHFESYPYTSKFALDKVISLAKIVCKYSKSMKLYSVNFKKIQEEIHKNCDEQFMITMMRRFMMRISEIVANKNGLQTIITGESLGQVASQTIESITSSNSVVKIPVMRPLIAFDKLDTINISKQIGTYETSILPYEDCCTVFLPKYPSIKPKMSVVLEQEKKLDVEKLIEEAISEMVVYKIEEE